MNRQPRPAERRIGLFGLFGIGNYGNDGSLEAMLHSLGRAAPGSGLLCVCPRPGQVEADFGVPAVPMSAPGFASAPMRLLDRLLLRAPGRISAWGHALRTTRGLDALVVPGTGMLDDLGEGPMGFPYALFRWCLAAKWNGTPVFLVSVGAGPIKHPASRWLMRAAARTARYRSYRDRASRDFMAGIGCGSEDDRLFPDLAFGLPAPPAADEPGPRRLSVAVGVMTYIGWRPNQPDGAAMHGKYVEAMARFVGWLLERGHRVRLVGGDRSDQRALDDVARAVSAMGGPCSAGRLAVEPAASLHDTMRQMAGADVVVATRFHNVVCALKLGKPVLSIGYAPKNDELLAEVGLGAFCQHIERMDEALLREQFARLAERRQEHGRGIEAVVAAYRERLGEQEALLARTLPAGAPAARGAAEPDCAGARA